MSPFSRSEKLMQIMCSERLGRDMSTLMNSPFWVEALKKGFAKGVGDRLYFQLTEAQTFIRDFVSVYISMKKICLKKNLQIGDSHKITNATQQKIKSNCKTTPSKCSKKSSIKTNSIEQNYTEIKEIDMQSIGDRLTALNSYDDVFIHSSSLMDISSSACLNLNATAISSPDFNNNNNNIFKSYEKSCSAANEKDFGCQKIDSNDEVSLTILYDHFDDDDNQKQSLNKFIIECSYLAILVSDEVISTTSALIHKIHDWFPDMNFSSLLQKTNVEQILKQSPLFKRLMNINKVQTTKPIILGKRPTVWSINNTHLKIFFKCFQKLHRALPQIDQQPILPLITQHQLLSQRVWKLKVEQLKLYMQLKHNGFMWLSNSPSPTHDSQMSLNNSRVTTPQKIPYNINESQTMSHFDCNNENSYSCFPPSFVFTKIAPTFKANKINELQEPSKVYPAQIYQNPSSQNVISTSPMSPSVQKFVLAPISSLFYNNENHSFQMPPLACQAFNSTNGISYFGNSGNTLISGDEAFFNEVPNEISIEDDLLF